MKFFFCVWMKEFGPDDLLLCKVTLVQSVLKTGPVAMDRI